MKRMFYKHARKMLFIASVGISVLYIYLIYGLINDLLPFETLAYILGISPMLYASWFVYLNSKNRTIKESLDEL